MESKSAMLLLILASVVSFSAATLIQTTAPYVAQVYVPQINRPRVIILDPEGDILVSSAGSVITAVREVNNGNGTATVTTTVIVQGTGLGLNHGLAYSRGFLYASSPSAVFRWPYRPGQFHAVAANSIQTVINGIPTGGHSTRPLDFDSAGLLYVAIGTLQNAALANQQSRIRRFNLEQQFLPIPFSNGQVFAQGCRNTVGFTFHPSGTMWSVDMGADMLNRPDLGGALWGNNPGDEMNSFPGPIGRHYGHPYCWSTFNLPPFPRGHQFVWPTFMNNGVHSDDWCRNPNNNFPPHVSFPAHSSPMSISFYNGASCGVNGGFPCSSVNHAFVTFRGSWHQGFPNGYKVSWYPFNNQGMPTGNSVDILFAPNAVPSCNTCLRPAGASFNRAGHLIVGGDTTHQLFRVAHNTNLPTIINRQV